LGEFVGQTFCAATATVDDDDSPVSFTSFAHSRILQSAQWAAGERGI